jgi:hypothetical protein
MQAMLNAPSWQPPACPKGIPSHKVMPSAGKSLVRAHICFLLLRGSLYHMNHEPRIVFLLALVNLFVRRHKS